MIPKPKAYKDKCPFKEGSRVREKSTGYAGVVTLAGITIAAVRFDRSRNGLISPFVVSRFTKDLEAE